MRAVERSIAAGFAIPRPAMSGAEPWTGSKIPGGLAEARRCCEAETAGQRRGDVERMSPKVFSVTMTSKLAGLDELQGGVVDEHVVEPHLRVLPG